MSPNDTPSLLRGALIDAGEKVSLAMTELADEFAQVADLADAADSKLRLVLAGHMARFLAAISADDVVCDTILDAEPPDPAGDYADFRHGQRVADELMGGWDE